MSSFVDHTSSLTSLSVSSEPAEKADRPRQQIQASTSPAPSMSPCEAASALGNRPTRGGKRKREKTFWIWTHGEEVSVDGAAYWQCSLYSNRKQYKVSAGTRAPAIHLKESHAVEEEINRKASTSGVGLLLLLHSHSLGGELHQTTGSPGLGRMKRRIWR
jgi:hypothetical protein